MQQIVPDEMSGLEVPLSPGMETGDLIFVSGQIPRDPDTGEIVGDDIQEQTAQTLENIETVLEEAGASLDDVVKTQVFLTSVDSFDGMNEVYDEYMSEPYPSRSAFEVGDLAADILVEIEAIAEK
jgi:reactive intermediate/imine deaminase